jgi:hypothetical protein
MSRKTKDSKETNYAVITAGEQRQIINLPGCVNRLLVKKGFKAKGRILPKLSGELWTWEDKRTGDFHYCQIVDL